MHNKVDSPCARQTIVCSQGNISENGQRYTQQWGAETVGGFTNVNQSLTTGSLMGEFQYRSLLNVQSGQHKSITMGTSAALCDQIN